MLPTIVADVSSKHPAFSFNPTLESVMKPLFALAALAAITVSSSPVFAADVAELAQKKNCMACHSEHAKVVGPAYEDVAEKYAGQKDAVAKLSEKVMKGGVGAWGQIPMPANSVSKDEATQLVTWVLGIKKKK